jgi:iron complex transport system substrate-binding protein
VQSVADVPASLRLLGNVMGRPEEGEKAAKEIEGKLQSVQAKLPPESERPKVFLMVGTADAFWGAKPDSFSGDVVARLGAKNLVQSGPDTSQFPGFTSFSLEQLVALDPDVILVMSVGAPNALPTSRQLASNPAWNGLRASEWTRPGGADGRAGAVRRAARQPGDRSVVRSSTRPVRTA